MILPEENVTFQAVAEHIIGLSLPARIEKKIGRLVGFRALQNQTTDKTRLEDVPTAHRHDVLRTKQVIIGCGGGFRHECAANTALWPSMSEVDLALRTRANSMTMPKRKLAFLQGVEDTHFKNLPRKKSNPNGRKLSQEPRLL